MLSRVRRNVCDGFFGGRVCSSLDMTSLQVGCIGRARGVERELELVEVLLELLEQQVGEVLGQALDKRLHAGPKCVAQDHAFTGR